MYQAERSVSSYIKKCRSGEYEMAMHPSLSVFHSQCMLNINSNMSSNSSFIILDQDDFVLKNQL